jgi:hypothetical protein
MVALTLALAGCGSDDGSEPPSNGATRFVFDLNADTETAEHFYDLPYPFDLRLDAEQHPVLAGFPNPEAIVIIDGLRENAQEARGFPVVPVVWLRFTGALAARAVTDVIAADASSPIRILDVDPDSPERGRMFPVVAETLAPDPYSPENVLALAPRPGFVLRPKTSYAAVVTASAGTEPGGDIAPHPVLSRLAQRAPQGDRETLADAALAPLWETIANPDEVVAATVFTTGDVVADQLALSDLVVEKHDVTLSNLQLHDDPEVTEICVLEASVEYPQFQTGTPPFDTDGRFEIGPDGVPVEQRKEAAPVKIVLPKSAMPANGYPLIVNVHGSGGFSIAMVRPVDNGAPGAPIGPAFPYAARGFAMAGSAMPVNPERMPGAKETAYLNVNNLAAMRDTFRQGQLELRLFLEALLALEIDPATLAGCAGPVLPAGATHFRFDPAQVLVTGQSMGGMYTNMIAAIEPEFRAAIPTGAGGHWTHFILHTPLQNFGGILKVLLNTQSTLSVVHPVLGLGGAGLEAADPIVYVPRIAQRPLPGHPVRPVYEPVGISDSYFATETYDAVALAYGHRQAGSEVWPSMQQALGLDGLDGFITFPVQDDVESEDGTPYTGVVVQFEPKGLPGETEPDGHAIYSHRDDVKYQYSCFAESFVKTGKARVPAPKDDPTAPCE